MGSASTPVGHYLFWPGPVGTAPAAGRLANGPGLDDPGQGPEKDPERPAETGPVPDDRRPAPSKPLLCSVLAPLATHRSPVNARKSFTGVISHWGGYGELHRHPELYRLVEVVNHCQAGERGRDSPAQTAAWAAEADSQGLPLLAAMGLAITGRDAA